MAAIVRQIINGIELVPFSTGSDDQIISIINGYYNDLLTFDDIRTVWFIGDSRKIGISEIAPFYPSEISITEGRENAYMESYESQTIKVRIMDFLYDDLCEPINGHNKALITVMQVDELKGASTEFLAFDDSMPTKCEDISLVDLNWTTCRRREWCNTNYYNAIPIKIKHLIKKVYKYCDNDINNYFSQYEPSDDYIWLPSLNELGYSITTTSVRFYSENPFKLTNSRSIQRLNGFTSVLRTTHLSRTSEYDGQTTKYFYDLCYYDSSLYIWESYRYLYGMTYLPCFCL